MIDRHNYIEHFMDTSNEVKGIISSIRVPNDANQQPSQLDWKQGHTRFNYYEYDTPKSAPASDP